jgi:hypothetical protein
VQLQGFLGEGFLGQQPGRAERGDGDTPLLGSVPSEAVPRRRVADPPCGVGRPAVGICCRVLPCATGLPPQDTPGGMREVLNGIQWVLQSGARWQDRPEHFPP